MLLKACLNGSRLPEEHPSLPVTPQALARNVTLVVAAGAGAVHLHPKDAAGTDSLDAAEVSAAVRAVRETSPQVPVGVTTGAWTLPAAEDRVAAIRSWTALPDFASVNWHEPGADLVASMLLERGVGVEAGLWHLAAVDAWLASPHRDACRRVLLELPDGLDESATRLEADRLVTRVRAGGGRLSVLLHGEGTSCWPAIRYAVELGLDTRIGLEDVLTLPDGSPAPDNAALVAAARTILVSGGGT